MNRADRRDTILTAIACIYGIAYVIAVAVAVTL